MRQVSTLQQNAEFKLDRQEALAGFVGFYRDKHLNKGTKPLDFLWQTFAMLLMPNISGMAFSARAISKSVRELVIPEQRAMLHPKTTLYRVQAEQKFVLKAVLMGIGNHMMNTVVSELLGCYNEVNPSFSNETALGNSDGVAAYLDGRTFNTVFTGEQLATRFNTHQRGREILREAILNASIENVGGKNALVIRFNIPYKQAEYLAQSKVMDIKNANFYAFLYAWVNSNLATDPGAVSPPYSIAMAKISAMVKAAEADTTAKVTKRVNEDSLLVTHLNEFLWIPQVDNTDRYEQALIEFGSRNDGSFSYDQTAAEPTDSILVNAPRKRLPANMPLLTDWVNRKFAYVNGSGNVDTIDLGACVPVGNFHIKQLLDNHVSTKSDNPLFYALFLANQTRPGFMREFAPTPEEMDPRLWRTLADKVDGAQFLNELPEKVAMFQAANNKRSDEELLVVTQTDKGAHHSSPLRAFHPQSSITEYRFVGRAVTAAAQVIEDNLEVIFRQYSVTTVLEAIAVLKIFTKYCPRYDVVNTADREDRAAYIEQGIDPDYKVEARANFRKDTAFMPHQNRADNKMRRGPKFAIYEVDAGGGKTMLILTNILKELKDKRCRRPIIACPPHLVSSYVKEAVYFTEGKMNVVPITNVSMKQHGEEHLTKLIQKAPVNTIFITDFDFIRNKSTEVSYGNKMITVYKNAEFLRSQEFDLICVDESHYLRAPSRRTRAVQSFMIEIPMKRLASGTFVADTVADVAPQFGLFDPTVFGTRDQFMRTYAGDMKGTKVLAWRENAEVDIRRKMAEHCVLVNHKRKEWAALLPMPVEEFFGVELTDNQRALYESILTKTIEKLREAVANDPELRDALESNDDTKVEELQVKLRRYLARLEAFLSTPETDEAGKEFLLLPEDKVSPKVRKIYDRIRAHTDNNIPGKILIFTNYVAAAESVYNNAPPDIKKRMILYTAQNKMECKAQFETQDNKDIMVGVETSMNTGLNFQFVSRLIRMETVWTPGVLEQGNARVNRPNVKKKETRANIYFDWIVINKTIDITKISRLISKMISKAKFDEYDNPAYAEVPSVPQVAMTIDTIQAHNDFEGSLLPYLESYEKYKQVQKADYDNYRAANQGALESVPIPAQGLLEGSKLMTRVPYIPDMEVYGEGELGLIRYDQFIHQDAESLEEDDDDAEADGDEGEDDNTTDPKYAKLLEERALMKGQPVHTEWGDGVVTGLGKRRARVLFPDGTRKAINKLAIYVITRASTNSKDMRDALLKEVGELPLTEPFSTPVEEGVANKKRRNPAIDNVLDQMTTPSAEFDITIVNDYLAIAYRSTGDGKDAMIGRLSNFGFVKSFDYYYSRLVGPRNLLVLFKEWQAAGFTMDKDTSLTFKHVHQALKGDKTGATSYGFATEQGLKNWLRTNIKPTSNPKEIHPYPIVQDEKIYIALPLQGQAGTRAAIKHQPMNIRWKLGGGEQEVLRFVPKASDIPAVLKEIKGAGIEITNLDELKEQYESFKRVRPRA